MAAERGQGIGAHLQGPGETLGADVGVVADQLLLAGKSQAVHEHIDRAPLLLHLLEHRLDLGRVLHVQGLEQAGVQRRGELTHLALEAALLIRQVGDPQLTAGGHQLLGDAPGDRAVVGDARDEGFLAAQIEEHGGDAEYRPGNSGGILLHRIRRPQTSAAPHPPMTSTAPQPGQTASQPAQPPQPSPACPWPGPPAAAICRAPSATAAPWCGS